ncbi:magnesium transporter [Pseudomaricurvus sp. HS19]|uniref:magnesium transporter n=1 Tax=Pseudomaricurvus sp. HS19 TaxID=2692626 RepID=UPI00136CB4F1|nr:magnesium transporter [Pseudomaricurvus sp. HS19]MYM65086.1 magnesium transporter [Pseudomaricurvus sp. HS19]
MASAGVGVDGLVAEREVTPGMEVVDHTLTRRFLLDFPRHAARIIEATDPQVVASILDEQDVHVQLPVWLSLLPNVSAALLPAISPELSRQLLTELPPHYAVKLLGQLEETEKQAYLALLDEGVRHELTTLMSYPLNSAGQLMDTRITHFRQDMTAGQALDFLRNTRLKTARALFLVDGNGRLAGKAHIQDIAVADPDTALGELSQPVTAAVSNTSTKEEVSELFERRNLLDLPVVDLDNHLLGIIYHASLLEAAQQERTSDVLAMVGASREERALSSPLFAVKKRMPWLQINLLTAFMAASVVGLFESTIAQFTALAVLLPVVAGQSGNAGAQALAVTMRGLALREITIRQWSRVMFKEVGAGLMNGLCIAFTCGIGVYLWSGSVGLVMVICTSMILAMVAAGFAGALVPIILVRLGQDPAQASSIILTTITDIAGFFAFLGIASLLASML